MSNSADATIDIDVNDDTAAALSRILANVRAVGAGMGATQKDIDKASRGVSRSLGNMAAGAAGASKGISATSRAMGQAITKASPYAKSIQLATRNLAKYESQVRLLSSATQGKNGQFYAPGFQGSISKSAMADMDNQLAKRAQWAKELQRLQQLEDTLAGPTRRATGPRSQASGMDIAKLKADAEGMSRSVRTMRKEYSAMWGAVSAVNGRQVFPPEMLRSTKEFTRSIMEASNASRYLAYDVGRNLTIAGVGVAALGVAAIGFAAKWEHSFAEVARTTGATGAALGRIRDGIVGLSTSMPVGFGELSEIAALGAQMGIAADGIVGYTETVAKLVATTNLTGDAAGKALGRFQAFFSDTPAKELAITGRTFSNLASSILKVGVNSVATETGIVNVATQISSMARYAGMSADQVIGLSGALSSVGVPPELSRGVITRLFTKMGQAVSGGGSQLDQFAQISGRTSAEFQAAWNTDEFAYVFTDFIAGLNEIPNASGGAVDALHQLGITSVRDVPVLMRLAGAADSAGTAGALLAQTMNDSRQGFLENTEAALQYAKINDTLVSRIQVLGNSFAALFATSGGGTLGPIKEIVNFITDLTRGFTALSSSAPVLTSTLTAVSLLAGGLLILGGAGSRMAGTLVGFGQALQQVGYTAAQAAPKVRALGIAMGALTAITLAISAVAAIIGISAAAEEALNPVTDLNGALDAMKQDTFDANGAAGIAEFATGVGNAAVEAGQMASQADMMADALGVAEAKAYGAADGVAATGDAAQVAALQFGEASVAFLKSQMANSKEFADLFAGDMGADYSKLLSSKGFNMDTLIAKVAKSGRDAGAAYLEGITGETSNANIWESSAALNPFAGFEDVTRHNNGMLLGMAEKGVDAFEMVAGAALVSGEGIKVAITDATQYAGQQMEDFQIQGAEVFEEVGKGMASFVDPAAMIGFAQQITELEKFGKETEEYTNGAAAYKQAWTDAYGGTAFSMKDYMRVFRSAAGEQEAFYGNLQVLMDRGLDPSIISDLAAMGPAASQLVGALVADTDAGLQEFEALFTKTGFESMVALAAAQAAASSIVSNALSEIGAEGARKLSAALASGVSLEQALADLGLQADGTPIEVPIVPKIASTWDDIGAAFAAFTLPIPGPIVTPRAGDTGPVIGQLGSEVQIPIPGPIANPQAGDTGPAITSLSDRLGVDIPGPTATPLAGDAAPALGEITGQVKANPVSGPLLNSQVGNTWAAISTIGGIVSSNPISGPRLNPVAGSVGAALGALQGALTGRSLSVRVNAVPGSVTLPSVPASVTSGFAKGGYTGHGGKYEYAGDVHRGEFVMNAEATSRIGIGNLYAMMRQASGRQRAAGPGFSGGGYAGRAASGPGYTELSPRDRALLERLGDVALYLDGDKVSSSVAQRNFVSTRHGRG